MPDEKDFYKEIIDNLYDGIYFVDRERVITYWNKGAERITGYSAAQTVGRSCRDNLLNHVTANGLELCMSNCPLAAVMEDGREREAEVFLHHADGHRLPVAIRATALRDDKGHIIGAIESFSNNNRLIDTRHQLRELRQAALTDALTGTGNRRHLEGRMSAVIAEHHNNQSVAGLLFMDVDHFKQVNDSYGHNIGDDVLRMVANTIRYALRATDTVGRWGGEEFIAILYDVQDKGDLQSAAEKIRTLVEYSRLDVDTRGLAVTISIGGTLLRTGDTPQSLVQRADELMYRSKQAGRNRVTIG
ncbi:MAG TPA: sensor domain-containing diguanylate cyclase [Anaerolineales bacterium]|nr:sensor domain-containing diguanylate cyclase [Anaerolineales bacterium]